MPDLRVLPQGAAELKWIVFLSAVIVFGVAGQVIFGSYVGATIGLVLALIVGVALATGRLQGSPTAKHPTLVPSIFLGVMLFLVVYGFGSLYLHMSERDPSSFVDPTAEADAPFSRIDALYFSLAVLTTTGYGDIRAASEGARLLVSAEMVTALLFVGLIIGRLHHAFGRTRG